jgi:hypothetical protein
MSIRVEPHIALLRFYSVLPDAAIEACRIQTPVAHLKQIVDILASRLDYYPTKKPDGAKDNAEAKK